MGLLEPKVLAEQLLESQTANGTYDFSSRDLKSWILALEVLIAQRHIDTATDVVSSMVKEFPGVDYVRKMSLILGKLPQACDDTTFTSFTDDPSAELQIVPRTNADTVILAFTGVAGRLGMPLGLMHRWFGDVGVHVIYLRDRSKQAYNNGLGSLYADFVTTIEALTGIVKDLRAVKVCCFGNSIGGYGALRYGLALPAGAVLTYGAFTNLTESFCQGPRLSQHRIKAGADLRLLFETSPRPPRTRLVYCESHPDDAAHAENLRGLPTVWLDGVAHASAHDSFLYSIRQDELTGQLRHLISTTEYGRG